MSLNARYTEDPIEVVRETGRREIMQRLRNLAALGVGIEADAKDPFPDADRAVEKTILTAVSQTLSDALNVGEKSVAEEPKLIKAITTSGTCVIIDPIDGGGNFVDGQRVFGTNRAMGPNSETVFGLLYEPVMNDGVCATLGQGAFFANDTAKRRQITPRHTRPFETAKEFLPLDNDPAADRADVLRRFDAVCGVWDIRGSCHEYRCIASCEKDFLRSNSLTTRDHAAEQLLLHEASGWASVNGATPYVATLRKDQVIATRREEVRQGIRDLSVVLP